MAVNRMFGRSQRRRLAAALSAEGDPPDAAVAGLRDQVESPAIRGDLLPAAQRQLAALVPTRIAPLIGCFVATSLLIGLAVTTDFAREIFGRELIPESDRFTASLLHIRSGLSLQGQATLAGWLTQVFLLLAAATTLVVRSIQRHRRDEFSGRFRAWGWLAFVWLVAAAATATPLGPAVAATFVTLTETPFGPHGLGWWLTVGIVGLVVTVPWTVLRMRERLPTTLTLGLALLFWAAAVGCLWFSAADVRLPLLASAAWLAGSGLILLAMMLAVRSSLREIDGLCVLPQTRQPRKRREKQSPRPAAAPAKRTDEAVDEEPEETPNFTPAVESEAVTADDSLENHADDECDKNEPQRRLSKAERRRLRKLARSSRAA
jgi:hypothetical protein